MRARTKIQASGELKVEWRLSANVFLDPRTDGDPASPFLASMTMVVVVVDDLTGGAEKLCSDPVC